jgi:hypothetical protein
MEIKFDCQPRSNFRGKINPLMKKPICKVPPLGLKSSFFLGGGGGFKINFKEKNMEWQRENMATSGIMKSLDPIK